MKQSYLLTSSLFLLFACAACEEDDKMDMDKIDVPNGYALSAGTSTIFLNSSVAYDTNADWITGANSIRFNNGDGLRGRRRGLGAGAEGRGGKRALARAAADVAQRAQRLAHRAHHALRTAERCGGVVEIDHKKPLPEILSPRG